MCCDKEKKSPSLKTSAGVSKDPADKGCRWSKVMYHCASKTPCSQSGLDGLAWEGLHDGCLVTTNLLKCLATIMGRAAFWPWIMNSQKCFMFQPYLTLNSTQHDVNICAKRITSQPWNFCCNNRCTYVPAACVFNNFPVAGVLLWFQLDLCHL